MPPTSATLQLSGASRCFGSGEATTWALRDASLELHSGEFVALVGRSGSGKSTLLNLLGLLERPTTGTYLVNGTDTAGLSEAARAALRSTTFGYVFQAFHLIGELNVLDNVRLPLTYRRSRPDGNQIHEVLERVGLGHRLTHKAATLSGGEQQRVAIARALVADPAVLLADEPTGNLDSTTETEIVQLLRSVAERGCAVLVVTHNPDVAAVTDRTLTIRDGVLQRCSTLPEE